MSGGLQRADVAPFADAVPRLDEISVIGVTATAVIIAEVGVDMTRFPTAAHLSARARFAPGGKESGRHVRYSVLRGRRRLPDRLTVKAFD